MLKIIGFRHKHYFVKDLSRLISSKLYHTNIIDHYENPRNIGSLDKKSINVKFVKDRPGHDVRYALNSNKIKKELKWKASTKIDAGLKKDE